MSNNTITSVGCLSYYLTGKFYFSYITNNPNVWNKCDIYEISNDPDTVLIKSIYIGDALGNGETHQEQFYFTSEELAAIYTAMGGDRTDAFLNFVFKMYNDEACTSQYGEESSVTILVTMPQDDETTKPTATITTKPVTDLPSPLNELYLQGKSKIDMDYSDAQGKFGATISSVKAHILGKTYEDPHISEFISINGDIEVTTVITDSRGFRTYYTNIVNVLPYTKPRVVPISGENSIVCERCDESGNIIDTGTYLIIKAKRAYEKVKKNDTQLNFCSLRYRYKAEGGTFGAWETILANTAESDEIITGALLGGTLEPSKTYTVQISAIDSVGDTGEVTVIVPKDEVYMHKAGSLRSLGIGKYVREENMVDIAEDLTIRARGKVFFDKEQWVSLGLSTGVSESAVNCGRIGSGCYYRVCAGEKHIYVAFNCAFIYSGSPVQVNLEAIPAEYLPPRPVYAVCTAGNGSIATAKVDDSGIVSVETTASASLEWVDGYIDYWI